MPQIQGVQGCSCSVLPQTLGNEGDAVCSAFPQGKKMTILILILDFTIGLFKNAEPIISEPLLFLF